MSLQSAWNQCLQSSHATPMHRVESTMHMKPETLQNNGDNNYSAVQHMVPKVALPKKITAQNCCSKKISQKYLTYNKGGSICDPNMRSKTFTIWKL